MGVFGGKGAGGVSEAAVLSALSRIQDPEAGQDIVTLGLVTNLTIEGGRVAFTLAFTSQPALAKAAARSRRSSGNCHSRAMALAQSDLPQP